MKHAESLAKIFFFFVVGAVLAILIFVEHDIAITMSSDIKYTELISVILTALGVILAALAVFLGAIALYSWRNFDSRVKGHVEEYLEQFLKPTERYEAVRELIEDHRQKSKKLAEAEKQIENLSNFDEDAV